MVIYVIYVIYSISSGPNQFMTGPYICRPGKTLEGNKLLSWGIIYFDNQNLYSCHTMITFCIFSVFPALGHHPIYLEIMSGAQISPTNWAGRVPPSQPDSQTAMVEVVSTQCCVQIIRILIQANRTAVLFIKFIINIIIIT